MTCNNKCGGCGMSSVTNVLLIVGGLNWGLVGVGMLMSNDLNVVKMLLGSWPVVEAIVYVVVGIAAILHIFGCPCGKCKACKSGATTTSDSTSTGSTM